jgi:hypothetical protein
MTLVCAALAAWGHEIFEKNRPLQPSRIAVYFTTEFPNDIIAARASTGERGAAWSFAPASPMDLKGVYQAERCLNREWFCYDLRLPWEKVESFRSELLRRIGGHIRHGQAGEHVSTSEFEAETKIATSDFFGDSTKYHCGDIHGTIRVYLTRIDAQHARLIAVLNEHRVP